MEWIKYTLSCIKRNMSTVIFLCLIIFAISLYNYFKVSLELIALIFTPLFTLSILPIVEEQKAKWNTKYETFKLLYANRHSLVDYTTVQNLNIIDITFIDDKAVRKAWKELKECLKKSDSDLIERNTKIAELIKAMSVNLGLSKDISFSDIADSYYPVGLQNNDSRFEEINGLKVDFYKKSIKYLDNKILNNSNVENTPNN